MLKKYVLIVRDRIILRKLCTDEALACLDCYYKSPAFLWDGTLSSLDTIIDRFQEHFSHFYDWTADVVDVEYFYKNHHLYLHRM